MKEKAGERVCGGRSLEERLQEYPELRARFEEMLAIVENADGDIVKADEAEERVIQELRQLGQSALQEWAERKQRRVQRECEGQNGVTRKVKNCTGRRGWDRSRSRNKSMNVAAISGDRSAPRLECPVAAIRWDCSGP